MTWKKSLAYIAVIFCLLIAADYLVTLFDITFQNFSLRTYQGGGLTSVNFDFFKKGGIGYNYITQGYGVTPYSSIYPDDWHDGIDIGADYGAPIYSPATTSVVFATGNEDLYCYHKAFGKFVALKDNSTGLILFFAHLGDIDVMPGQTISSGTEIGTIGDTGEETGPHLHFSIFEANGFTMTPRLGCGPEPTGQDVNPLNYLGTVYK